MPFLETASGIIGKLALSVGGRSLSEGIKDFRTQRRMQRMVDDAVDRIVEQLDVYLNSEGVNQRRKEILISSLAAKLQPLMDSPERFFAGNLDGNLIFKQCHPKGELPEEIREEDLEHFYTMLFPQIAHFLAGSRTALTQWQAEGYREEFRRLSQLAEEIRALNVKVAELPAVVAHSGSSLAEKEAETLLRELAQTLFNSLLLRLDLSPLRAERALYGSLRDHFVVPAFQERRDGAEVVSQETILMQVLVSHGARRVVHGGAGVGKTTWSLWFQSRLLESAPGLLALVFRLREFPDIENRSLLELLQETAGPHLRDSLTDNLLRAWHTQGRLVIILDGFDEVSEERREAVEKWIKNLAAIAKQSSIIVTSRPLQSGQLESLATPWQQWDLLPFDEPRIVEFIERWHRYMPEGELSLAERQVDASALARTFFSDPSLKPLADTPLMLGTLLFVHHRDKELPSGRVDLYERYIAAMLGLRDSGLGIQARATKLSDKEKRRILGHIALHFHLNGINEVNDPTMRELVSDGLKLFHFKEDVDRLLAALCERTGLLQGPGAWSFMHKTIGEFLVAELICDGTTQLTDKCRLDRKELWKHRHEDQWAAVLFFWAGKTSPRELEEFVDDLLKEQTEKAAMLAVSLLSDQGDRLTQEIQRTLLSELLKQRFEHSATPGNSVATMSTVPRRVFKQIRIPSPPLRGLSEGSLTRAFAKFFRKGLLDPSIIRQLNNPGDNHLRDELTIASIWALAGEDTKINLDVRHFLGHVEPDDFALYSFRYRLYAPVIQGDSIARARSMLNEWLAAFVEQRFRTSLLLLGALHDAEAVDGRPRYFVNCRAIVGPLLWERINEPVDEVWLIQSVNCTGWGRNNVDILEQGVKWLDRAGPSEWGVTPQQHTDLQAWCRNLVTVRADLIAKRVRDA